MSEGWNCVSGKCGICDDCRRQKTPKQKFNCCICGKEFEIEPYRWMPKKVPCNECLRDMVIP